MAYNHDFLVLSDGYAGTMNGQVLPALHDVCSETTMPGFQGKPIHCLRYDAVNPRGTVVVLHGFTESALKFSELIYSLVQNGFSVLTCDQRGHGLSWRKDGLPGTYLTHVDDFDEYVSDLSILCDTLLADMPAPYHIFSHSMGGAVTALFLERRQDVFAKAVMCAPMIAPNRSGLSFFAAKMVTGGAFLLGRSEKIPFVNHPYAGHEDFAQACANGKARFDWYDDIRFAHPEYQNNSPTYRWMDEALNVTGKILAPGEPEKITAQVWLFTAALDDVVLPEPQSQFISRVKNGKHTTVQGAKHEIYRSPDEVVFPWWHDILAYLH